MHCKCLHQHFGLVSSIDSSLEGSFPASVLAMNIARSIQKKPAQSRRSQIVQKKPAMKISSSSKAGAKCPPSGNDDAASGGQTPQCLPPTSGGQPSTSGSGGQTPQSALEADRGWKRFPDSRAMVCLGSDKKLSEGVYKVIRSGGKNVFVLIAELPEDCSDDEHPSIKHLPEGDMVFISHGTATLYDNDIVIYPDEICPPTPGSSRTGFLVVGSRADLGLRTWT